MRSDQFEVFFFFFECETFRCKLSENNWIFIFEPRLTTLMIIWYNFFSFCNNLQITNNLFRNFQSIQSSQGKEINKTTFIPFFFQINRKFTNEWHVYKKKKNSNANYRSSSKVHYLQPLSLFFFFSFVNIKVKI